MKSSIFLILYEEEMLADKATIKRYNKYTVLPPSKNFFSSISYLKRQFNFFVAWFYFSIWTLTCCTRTQYTSWITGGQNSYTRKEIFSSKQINWNLWYAIFSTAGSIAYKFCTRPISRHLYSGIFKEHLNKKHKIFKNKLNS